MKHKNKEQLVKIIVTFITIFVFSMMAITINHSIGNISIEFITLVGFLFGILWLSATEYIIHFYYKIIKRRKRLK